MVLDEQRLPRRLLTNPRGDTRDVRFAAHHQALEARCRLVAYLTQSLAMGRAVSDVNGLEMRTFPADSRNSLARGVNAPPVMKTIRRACSGFTSA